MTTLEISHTKTSTDDLGRFVTTLTQEVFVKVNENEEDIIKKVLQQLDNSVGCIEYRNEDYSVIEASGYGVNKAIETVNSISGVKYIVPVTSIDKNEIYRVEFIY